MPQIKKKLINIWPLDTNKNNFQSISISINTKDVQSWSKEWRTSSKVTKCLQH